LQLPVGAALVSLLELAGDSDSLRAAPAADIVELVDKTAVAAAPAELDELEAPVRS